MKNLTYDEKRKLYYDIIDVYEQMRDCIESFIAGDYENCEKEPYLWVYPIEGGWEAAICEAGDEPEHFMYDLNSFISVDSDTGLLVPNKEEISHVIYDVLNSDK